jgi:predicted transcriptional regulator
MAAAEAGHLTCSVVRLKACPDTNLFQTPPLPHTFRLLTWVLPVFRLGLMEVNNGPDLQASLPVWTERGRDTQALVQKAIETFVDYDEWFLREVDLGLAAAERGEFVDHRDTGRLIDRRYHG